MESPGNDDIDQARDGIAHLHPDLMANIAGQVGGRRLQMGMAFFDQFLRQALRSAIVDDRHQSHAGTRLSGQKKTPLESAI